MKKCVSINRSNYITMTKSQGWCTFQILGGCQGRRTGVEVTTVSNSLILGRVGDKSFEEWRQK